MFRPIVRELLQIVLLALVIYLALHFMVQNFRIDGTSMEPNLHDGEYVLVSKVSYWFGNDPGRGDVIIFQAPDQPQYDRIKRVIGLPGESVEVRRDGSVYIDGQPVEEPYVSSTPGGPVGTWEVPQDEFFVMGDNRGRSYDSRNGGPVPRDNIIGKAWVIIWPMGEWGGAPNFAVAVEPATS